MKVALQTGPNDAGRRLDRILRKAMPEQPLSLIHRLLRQKKVLVNGKPANADDRLETDMTIQFEMVVNDNDIPVYKKQKVNETLSLPDILWQGSGVIVFNKPRGLSTHGHNSLNTIVNVNLAGSLPPSLSFKPGPLHRLDKQTSGLIVFSQSIEGARLFSRLLQERKLQKTYLAIVEGCLEKKETWQDMLLRDRYIQKTFLTNGKSAQNSVTTVIPLASSKLYSLVKANIITGRTHQIRAQAAAHGYPLAGDRKYGGHDIGEAPMSGFFLHAWNIKFNGDPEEISPGFPQEIDAPLPQPFLSQIALLFGQKVKSKIMHSNCR